MLNAARQALESRPPSAITGRQLARAAGTHYSLIHRHFGSNEALLSVALVDIGKHLRDDVFEDIPRLPDTAGLRQNHEALRAKVFARLDHESYTTLKPESTLGQGYNDIIVATRPGLTHIECAALTATTISLQLGVVLFSDLTDEWVGLPLRHPVLDEQVDRWIAGATSGQGPLALEPIPRRELRQVSAPRGTNVPKLKGRKATERKLVEAGADLLADMAPTAISGRSIAAAAGVNYGLIHHYFGSKDEVLRQALALYRERFVQHRPDYTGSTDYFAMQSTPGLARAIAWAALDPDRPFEGQPFPIGRSLLSNHLSDGEEPTDAIRVSLFAVTVAQLVWSLFSTPFTNTLGYDAHDLEPMAATLFHRIIEDGRRSG